MTKTLTEEEKKAISNWAQLVTVDPTVTLHGRPIVALTMLLFRVCGNDDKKFEEACRLIDLIVVKAIGQALIQIEDQANQTEDQ